MKTIEKVLQIKCKKEGRSMRAQTSHLIRSFLKGAVLYLLLLSCNNQGDFNKTINVEIDSGVAVSDSIYKPHAYSSSEFGVSMYSVHQ